MDDDEEFETITVVQLFTVAVVGIAIFTVAVAWNTVSLTAEAVQAVKHKLLP